MPRPNRVNRSLRSRARTLAATLTHRARLTDTTHVSRHSGFSLVDWRFLAESSLAFLGFGIPPPVPAWGGMLSGIARSQITREPLMSVWPGLAIALAVFGFNMLGDALRDVLDPRLRGSR